MIRTPADVQIATDDVWESVPRLIERFVDATERFALRCDAGFEPGDIRRRIQPILRDWQTLRDQGLECLPGGPVLFASLGALRERAPKTYRKTLPRIAAGAFIHATLRSRMDDDGMRRALSAAMLHELMENLLDDILDEGGFTHSEADQLYDRCFRPVTDPAASIEGLEAELAVFMGPAQEGFEGILAAAATELRRLLAGGDPMVLREISRGFESLSAAQAGTVFLRREAFDPSSLAKAASDLPSPDLGFEWLDRLAICASWTSITALQDIRFTSARVSDARFAPWARAWLFYNAVVSYLEHMAGIEADVREGVLNFACLHAQIPLSVLEEGRFPGFQPSERDALFGQTIEFLGRAMQEGKATGDDLDDYRLLAVAIPAIIFAIARSPEEIVAAFAQRLGSAMRVAKEARVPA